VRRPRLMCNNVPITTASRRSGEISEPSDGTAKANPLRILPSTPRKLTYLRPIWVDIREVDRDTVPGSWAKTPEPVVRLQRKKSAPLSEF
jgi:hypothetical protein